MVTFSSKIQFDITNRGPHCYRNPNIVHKPTKMKVSILSFLPQNLKIQHLRDHITPLHSSSLNNKVVKKYPKVANFAMKFNNCQKMKIFT